MVIEPKIGDRVVSRDTEGEIVNVYDNGFSPMDFERESRECWSIRSA
jgi:hypothetical protein